MSAAKARRVGDLKRSLPVAVAIVTFLGEQPEMAAAGRDAGVPSA